MRKDGSLRQLLSNEAQGRKRQSREGVVKAQLVFTRQLLLS